MKKVDGRESAPQKSMEKPGTSPQLSNAHSVEESSNFINEVSVSGALIMSLLVMDADFEAIKKVAPDSWRASREGNLYWRASIPGHLLALDTEGNITIDGENISTVLENLLADIKSTGEGKI